MASVVDIKAVAYDVCGVARTVDSGFRAKVKKDNFVLSSASSVLHSFWVNCVTSENIGCFDPWTRECKTPSETNR